jgi:hypothetical protein
MAKRKVKRSAAKPATDKAATAKRKANGATAAGGNPKVLVVNMIPKALSGEANQDSEPTLAVNLKNPLQMVGTAFTPDPGQGDLAPIYVTVDGGNTWTLNSIVPSSAADGSATADITVSFGATSNVLYAGIIRMPIVNDATRLNILSTANFLSVQKMKVLVDRTGAGVDQPYVQASTVGSGADKGHDAVFVGNNDFNAQNGATATVDHSTNATHNPAGFQSTRVEKRQSSGQDGPSVRPAIHADGTVYAVFHAWRAFNQNTGDGTADIVVVRDDAWGKGAQPFTALTDPADHLAGVRVAKGRTFNFGDHLGLQRIGGDVSIAVDPRDSSNVYLAWADGKGRNYTLHVRRSTDRGLTWSAQDLHTVKSATNPALAVNSGGRVGFLYQALTGTGASQRWVTKIETSDDGTNWTSLVLATVPASTPARLFEPYLGDYEHLMAVGADFHGIFSTANTPDLTHFPNGVVFQRNHDFPTRRLLDVDGSTPVSVSIDPFYFKVTA